MNRRFRLVVSGACAAVSVALCLAYGEHVRRESERVRAEALERYGGEVVTLVIAAEGIEAGEPVTRANAVEREWLVDLAPTGAVTGLDEVLGDEVSVPAAAGAPLTELNFRDDAEAVEVPEDKVAIAVAAGGELGVAPGTSVGDVLAAYEVGEEGVRLISADVRVLSGPQAAAGGLSPGLLTVAVAPDDVAWLLSASGEGSLRLALPGERALEFVEADRPAPTSVPAVEGQAGTADEKDGEGGEGA